jgi:hypothetical protein
MMIVTFALAALLGHGAEPAKATPTVSTEPTLEQIRAATQKYKDVKAALADGYVRDPMDQCVVASDIGRPATDGAMGIHYIRMDLLGIKGPPNPRIDGTGMHTDFNAPAVLLYEPQPNGSLELVAVENLVFQKAWAAAGHTKPPEFQGVTYTTMQDDPATPVDEAHMFTPHYDRHVWLYRENPKGVFADFNTKVSCAAFKPKAEMHQMDSPHH